MINATESGSDASISVEKYDISKMENYKKYEEMCNNFDSMIYNENAANSTSRIDFLLAKIYHKGRAVCQILEAPGEHYFDPENPKGRLTDHKYLSKIISSPNRKIWAIMVEPDKTNKKMQPKERNGYVDRIKDLKKRINSKDKVLFVFNKIDETPIRNRTGQSSTRRSYANNKILVSWNI